MGLLRNFWALVLCLSVASQLAIGRVEALENPRLDPPPAHIDRWLRIIWLAPQTHPVVPAYFLPGSRKAPKNTIVRYVPLALGEYQSLVKFTHALRCSTDMRLGIKPPYPKTMGIEEYADGKKRLLCVLPAAGGCEYLFAIAKLPGIDWSHKDTFPLYQFEAELECKGSLAEYHDADGHIR
jgi:hypothetical protein